MLAATLLALGSATLHASWNLLVKTSRDRDLSAWGQFLFAGLLVLPVLAVIGVPPVGAWPYLLASGLVHVAYVTGLVKAYTHGDFSLAYPLARGGGAFFAAIGGVLVLGDVLGPLAWLAIAVVAAGLLSLVRKGTSRASLWWALFTALTIAAYTLIDSRGARLAYDLQDTDLASVRYGFALMPVTAVTLSVANVARGRLSAFREGLSAQWTRYLVAGVFVTAAYTLVLVAVLSAPVGYVTMLRESSVVLGALAGWLFLHERLGRHRVVSSLIIVAGLCLLVAAEV